MTSCTAIWKPKDTAFEADEIQAQKPWCVNEFEVLKEQQKDSMAWVQQVRRTLEDKDAT